MQFRKHSPIKQHPGFTLVEMVLSIAVLAIIALLFTPAISAGIDLFLMSRTQEQLSHEARFILNSMLEELKQAEAISNIAADEITFTTCADCNPASATITYHWDSGSRELTRFETVTDVLAQRVTFVQFSVFNSSDYPFNLDIGSGATSPIANVNLVQIRLRVVDDTGTRGYDLATRVMPRYL